MNNEERDLISKFVARVGGQGQGGFGSVPNTQPALPAIDPEADQFIGQQFQQYPEPSLTCKKSKLYPVQHKGIIINFAEEVNIADCHNQIIPTFRSFFWLGWSYA